MPAATGGQPSDGDPVLQEIAAGQVAPAYLVHGPDRLRHEEVVQALRERLVSPGWGELNEASFEGSPSTVPLVVEAASMPPLGGGRRLLIVRANPLLRPHGEGKGDGVGAAAGDPLERLVALLRHPPPTACLVLLSDFEVPASHRLLAAVRASGRVVPARRPGPRELAAWLQQEAGRLGKRLPPALAAALVARCQAERILLRNELAKMAAHAGTRTLLTQEDLEAVVGKSREERVFDLVDAVVARRADRAAALARDLLRQGEAPLGLVALIARQYRLVWQARRLKRGEVARRLELNPYLAEKAWRQARGVSEAKLAAALEAILEAETAIKTGALPPEVALELLCVALAAQAEP